MRIAYCSRFGLRFLEKARGTYDHALLHPLTANYGHFPGEARRGAQNERLVVADETLRSLPPRGKETFIPTYLAEG